MQKPKRFRIINSWAAFHDQIGDIAKETYQESTMTDKQMTRSHRAALRDTLIGAILAPVLLVPFGILGQFGPSLWIPAAFGLIAGILWSRHKFPSWLDFQRQYTHAEPQLRPSGRTIADYISVLAGVFALSLIGLVLGEFVRNGIVGLGVGIAVGCFVWPLSLYLRRGKPHQII